MLTVIKGGGQATPRTKHVYKFETTGIIIIANSHQEAVNIHYAIVLKYGINNQPTIKRGVK